MPTKEDLKDIPWGTGYGWGKRNTRQKRQHPEQNDQIALSAWLHAKGIKHHSSPNGEKRSSRSGDRLKAMGMLCGIPDLIILVMRGGHGALFLELKQKDGGKIQKNQLECQRYLREAGYMSEIVNGFDEAKETVLRYLALGK
jgi:hypothetical protein